MIHTTTGKNGVDIQRPGGTTMKTKMTQFGGLVGALVAEENLKALTFCMMFLVGLASITFAQSSSVPQTDTEPDRLAQASDTDRASTDQNVVVAQAPAQAPAQAARCINPKTGQPDHLVECVVAPCREFKPPSPFATCVDNFCGGCHAILCGILLEDVSGGFTPPNK
jgi:hypothetical protein